MLGDGLVDLIESGAITNARKEIDKGVTINGALIGNRKGEGRDYGVRLRLWDNKVNASIARYTTDDANLAVGYDNTRTFLRENKSIANELLKQIRAKLTEG